MCNILSHNLCMFAIFNSYSSPCMSSESVAHEAEDGMGY